MTLATILAFATMTALLIISPGPNGVLIARTVPTSGRAAGFANIAGFAVAFFVHGTFAIFGLSLVLLQSAQLFMLVKLAGAAYLVWIGLKALVEAWRGLPAAIPGVAPAPPDSVAPTSAYLLVAIHAALNLAWFGPMVLLFEKLSAAARNGRIQRWVKALTGMVFIGFGIKLATLRA